MADPQPPDSPSASIQRLSINWGMRFLCVLLLASPAWAGRCAVPPAVAEMLQNLPSEPKARNAAISEALKDNPDDFTLNRMFLDARVYEKRAVRERYQREFEAHPDSLDSAYLYARSLVGSNTPGALKIYAQILAKDPEYPWVHLSQLEIYRAEAFRDRRKLEASFVTLRRVCPAEWKPFEYLSQIEDTGLVAREAARLRELLAASKDPRSLRLYGVLWAAEFRLRPAGEHEAERRTIAEDLKRLRPFESLPEIQTVMASGARLSGDEALAKQVAPRHPPDVFVQYRDWRNAHPQPKPDDPPAKRRSYAQAQFEAATRWIELAPDDTLGYAERFRALVALEAPADDLGRAGDDLLAAGRRKDLGPHSFFLSVARGYLERGVLLDRVPAILEEALKSFDDPESVIEIDLAPSPELTASNRMLNVADHAEAVALLSEFYEKQGHPDQARVMLRSLEDYLAAKAPSKDEKNQMVVAQYRNAQFAYWFRLASLADHEGRKLDALAAYREASRSHAIKTVLAAERRLWKELGGSDEAWSQWISATPEPVQPRTQAARAAFTPANRPLPEFSLKDIAGNTWTLARFKGKTTIAVVWATWCAPCREELPYFATLAERLKDRHDVQAVSFNTDENSGAVELFLKQRGYTFPVLLAQHFAEDLMPYFSIPRTWILRDGVLVAESAGFSGDREKWPDDVIAQIK
jgi:thiol-disulfide isomerase/thioredoxin